MASRCLTQVYKDTGIIIKCLFMIRMFVRIPFAFFFLHFKLRHLNWTLVRELFLLNFPNTSYTLKPTFLKSYFREINENEIIALRKCQGHFDCQQLRQTRRNTTPVESSFVENLAKNTLPKEISDLMNTSISFLRT